MEHGKTATGAVDGRIRGFPISFFAVALGLMGLTLAWQKAEPILDLPVRASLPLLYASTAVFAAIFIAYIAKIARYPDEAKKEFRHPVKLNFFPLLAKILLIMSIIFLAIDMGTSSALWWAGVILQLAFTLIIISAWFQQDIFEVHHMSPAWFIPIVGCIIVPIAGLSHFSPELSWFFFSIGVFWWLMLATIVVNRIIFHRPMPEKLLPTMFILFAPPLIGYISLNKLMGGPTPFGNMLYYIGLFLFMLVAYQYKSFTRIKFYLSWWAYSFPLAALSIATLLMFHESGQAFFGWLSWGIFALLNLVVLLLVWKTASGIMRGEICVEEE